MLRLFCLGEMCEDVCNCVWGTVANSRLLCVREFFLEILDIVCGEKVVLLQVILCGEAVGYIYGTSVGRQMCCVRLLCVGRQF